MPKRIERINELIKRELGNIILREADFPRNILVTVSRVDTSVDLYQAKAYISVLPRSESKKVLYTLNRQIYDLQQDLNKRLNMGMVPKLVFVEEKGVAEAGRVEEILEMIKNKDSLENDTMK